MLQMLLMNKTHGVKQQHSSILLYMVIEIQGKSAGAAIMLTDLMSCLNLLWLAFLLGRHSGNLDLVQLVVELLIEAENICLTDILAHGFLLQYIAPLQHI